MNSLSMAPRWVYGRRLELVTRAFTLSVRRESSYLNARRASFHDLPGEHDETGLVRSARTAMYSDRRRARASA